MSLARGEGTALFLGNCTIKLSVFGCGRDAKEMLSWFHCFQAVFCQMTKLHVCLGGCLNYSPVLCCSAHGSGGQRSCSLFLCQGLAWSDTWSDPLHFLWGKIADQTSTDIPITYSPISHPTGPQLRTSLCIGLPAVDFFNLGKLSAASCGYNCHSCLKKTSFCFWTCYFTVSFDSSPSAPSSCFGRWWRIVPCSPLTCSHGLPDLYYPPPLPFCQAEVWSLFNSFYMKAISGGSRVRFCKMVLWSAWPGLWESPSRGAEPLIKTFTGFSPCSLQSW